MGVQNTNYNSGTQFEINNVPNFMGIVGNPVFSKEKWTLPQELYLTYNKYIII